MHDVLVIGAGPAGAAAAWALAGGGARVLLLDRSTFPRPKVCGDGVTARGVAVARQMGLDLATEPAAQPFDLCRLYLSGQETIDVPLLSGEHGRRGIGNTGFTPRLPFARQPSGSAARGRGYVVPRAKLDHLLVERALAAGAELACGLQAMDPLVVDGRVAGARARKAGGDQTVDVPARLTIAADGSGGGFSVRAGLRPRGRAESAAIRSYYSDVRDLGSALRVYHMQELRPFYGWIFPLPGGRANAGVAMAGSALPRLPLEQALRVFLDSEPARRDLAGAREESPARSFPLREGFVAGHTYGAGILAAGDAAGLINPVTGEGIAHALESGLLAGRIGLQALATGDLSAGGLSAYGTALQRIYGTAYLIARAGRALFQLPGFSQAFFTAVGPHLMWT